MVFVHSTNPTSDPSFRSSSMENQVDDLTQDYTEIKSGLCTFSMNSCSNMLKKLKECDDTDNCGLVRNHIIVPSTKKSCANLSDLCKTDLDETLKKLYDAGALTQDEDQVESIDEKIKELSDLKNLINSVHASSHITPVSGSKTGKKLEILPSDKAKKSQNSQAVYEKEEITV